VALQRPVLIAYRLCSGFRKGQVTDEAGVSGPGHANKLKPHPSERSLGWGHLSPNRISRHKKAVAITHSYTQWRTLCRARADFSRTVGCGEAPSLRERPIHHNGIGAEILSAVAEGWRLQHEAWVVQHTSVREAVHELKAQTAIAAEILELLRSRTP
jgi:hypothetical protein